MAAVARYLADTSVLARLRHRPVAAVLGPMIEAGLVATCGVIEFELGWAARSSKEFDEMRADRETIAAVAERARRTARYARSWWRSVIVGDQLADNRLRCN